jgi:hypothetical protein
MSKPTASETLRRRAAHGRSLSDDPDTLRVADELDATADLLDAIDANLGAEVRDAHGRHMTQIGRAADALAAAITGRQT